MSQHRARTSRRIGLTALALLATLPSAAHSQATDGFITTLAPIGDPAALVYDDGDVLVADRAGDRLRRIQPDGTVIRGGGSGNAAADCEDGTNDLLRPRGLAKQGDDILVASGNCILRIEPSGDIVRVAGVASGAAGFSGDFGSARDARLREPSGIAVAPDGSIFFADTGNHRIRRVSPSGGIATAVGGERGFAGDGGFAIDARLDAPRDVKFLTDTSLVIADTGNDRVRLVQDTVIRTVAGGGGTGFGGDGDPATSALLDDPTALVALPNGGFLVADTSNDRVRRVTPLGAIFTVVGGGTGADGGFAKDAQLNAPEAIAPRPGGGFAVADTGGGAVREVTDVGAVPGADFGRSLNVAPAQGAVTVRPLGQAEFLPLAEEDLIPFGSRVDARGGKLQLAVRRSAGTLEPGRVFAGMFVAITRGDVTNLRLVERLDCRTAARRSPLATTSKKKKRKRRLWVEAKGKYRIKGRYVGALERGTRWRVTDTCDASTVTVKRGSVIAVERIGGRRRIVRAPDTLTVRAPGA